MAPTHVVIPPPTPQRHPTPRHGLSADALETDSLSPTTPLGTLMGPWGSSSPSALRRLLYKYREPFSFRGCLEFVIPTVIHSLLTEARDMNNLSFTFPENEKYSLFKLFMTLLLSEVKVPFNEITF